MYYKIFITIKVLILSNTSHNQDFFTSDSIYVFRHYLYYCVWFVSLNAIMVGMEVGMDIMENVMEVPQKIKDIIMSHLTF